MIVVADSSPLIVLAKLRCLELINRLYPIVYVSAEVYREVVTTGAGLPGAEEVEKAKWIQIQRLQNESSLALAQQRFPLGVGELSTILLAKELGAERVLMDDYRARNLARAEGLAVQGTIGVLERCYERGYLEDLRTAFQQVLTQQVYIDRALLNSRLRSHSLEPLAE